VQVRCRREDLVAGPARRERVQLQLDRREVVPRRDVPEGLPGRDRVAEPGPGAAVDEPARVQVAIVDPYPAGGALIVDRDRLDAEIGREGLAEAREEAGDRLDGEIGIGGGDRASMPRPGGGKRDDVTPPADD